MQKTELAVICRPPDSSGELIRQSLVEIAEICQKSITPALVQIWVRDLSDIPADLLCRALEQLRKTWTSGFLPTPGNVRSLIDQANAGGFAIEAEDAWRRALKYATQHFHPDLGIDRRAPELPPEINEAIRTAGGLKVLSGCGEKDLVWQKKEFLEAYTRVHETRQAEHLLSRGKAKEILAQLAAGAQQMAPKQIPSATNDAPTGFAEDLRDVQNEFHQLREKLGPAAPITPTLRNRVRVPHDPPPENSAATPEGKAFREWARLYDRGETNLMWADYKAQVLETVYV